MSCWLGHILSRTQQTGKLDGAGKMAMYNSRLANHCLVHFGKRSTGVGPVCNPFSEAAFYRTDFQKTVQRILALDYKIPEKLQLSDSVKDLLSKIFIKDPNQRIDIAGIKAHEWYLHRLPHELTEQYQGMERYATE